MWFPKNMKIKDIHLDWQIRVFQMQEGHTSKPSHDSLLQGTKGENLVVSRISDSGGGVWFLFWLWNSRGSAE